VLILSRQWHVRLNLFNHEALMSRRVAAVCAEGLAVRLSGAAVGADLGGSSKYSSEALED
jgi:hypothetical protein